MGQLRGVFGFGEEAGPEGGILGMLVARQLDRDLSAEHGVGALPHLTHAAGRQAFLKAVAAITHGASRRVGKVTAGAHPHNLASTAATGKFSCSTRRRTQAGGRALVGKVPNEPNEDRLARRAGNHWS